MTDRWLAIPIVLGGAFAAWYAVADVLVSTVGALPTDLLFGVGVVSFLVWTTLAGILQSPRAGGDASSFRRTAILSIAWVGLFTWTAVVGLYAVVAIVLLFHPAYAPTWLWFGMVLSATVVGGLVAVVGVGAYRRWQSPTDS